MSYSNISYASTSLARDYVTANWAQSDRFLKKHIFARGAFLVLAPCSFITSAVDIMVGLGVGIGAICSFGTNYRLVKVTFNYLSSSNKIVLRPYVNILSAIKLEDTFPQNMRVLSPHGDGFLSNIPSEYLKSKARECYDSRNLLKRHLISRLTYILLAIVCLITRVIDGIISIPAAGFSILSGGEFGLLNNLAYRTLQAPGIINDLFYCTLKFINPWARTQIV